MSPTSLAQLEVKGADLRAALARIGDMRPGSLSETYGKCGKADLSLCQVRIARTRSELAFDADRGRQDRGPTDPLRTSGRAIKAAGGRVQALS